MKAIGLSIYQFSDYRKFLKEYLESVKNRNQQFSLRAFARKLELQASFLSDVLSGKKHLSLEKALQVGRLLKLEVKETTFFCYLIAIDTCTDPEQKEALMQELNSREKLAEVPEELAQNREKLDLNQFEVISSWECIALFELLTVYTKKPDLFYSEQLCLSKEKIEKSFILLEKAGLIQKEEIGFSRTARPLLISSDHHHLALKMYHTSMLEKARSALYTQSPSVRYTGTETLMIDPNLLPQAHQIMNQCLDQLLALFQQSQFKTSLIHIHFNLFELNTGRGKVGS